MCFLQFRKQLRIFQFASIFGFRCRQQSEFTGDLSKATYDANMANISRPLRLGTRSSPLARWQANWVMEQLATLGVETVDVHITTHGDSQLAEAISTIGGQGVFTKAIQQALLDDAIDVAVHSLKDLPTDPIEGITLGAVPVRASAGDALVASRARRLNDLTPGARIGTGSLRRRAQLLYTRPDLVMCDIRGNVDTRLRKLDEGQFDALVLAEAGLTRLGRGDRIAEVLPLSVMLPAVGQGALGLEARVDDDSTRQILARLDNPDTHRTVLAERSMLAALRGGCLAPVGAWGRVIDGQLHLDAVVLSADGCQKVSATGSASPDSAERLGQQVARQLIQQGAAELILDARSNG